MAHPGFMRPVQASKQFGTIRDPDGLRVGIIKIKADTMRQLVWQGWTGKQQYWFHVPDCGYGLAGDKAQWAGAFYDPVADCWMVRVCSPGLQPVPPGPIPVVGELVAESLVEPAVPADCPRPRLGLERYGSDYTLSEIAAARTFADSYAPTEDDWIPMQLAYVAGMRHAVARPTLLRIEDGYVVFTDDTRHPLARCVRVEEAACGWRLAVVDEAGQRGFVVERGWTKERFLGILGELNADPLAWMTNGSGLTLPSQSTATGSSCIAAAASGRYLAFKLAKEPEVSRDLVIEWLGSLSPPVPAEAADRLFPEPGVLTPDERLAIEQSESLVNSVFGPDEQAAEAKPETWRDRPPLL